MTIKKTLERLDHLRKSVSENRAVDVKEVNSILDFISIYTLSGYRIFNDLHRLLRKTAESGVVSKEDSSELTETLDSVYECLETERRIEMSLGWFCLMGFVMIVGYTISKIYQNFT